MKQIWIKDNEIMNSDLSGGDHFVDYPTYENSCKAMAKQDIIIDNLAEVVKIISSKSLDPDIKQMGVDLVLRVAKLRG